MDLGFFGFRVEREFRNLCGLSSRTKKTVYRSTGAVIRVHRSQLLLSLAQTPNGQRRMPTEWQNYLSNDARMHIPPPSEKSITIDWHTWYESGIDLAPMRAHVVRNIARRPADSLGSSGLYRKFKCEREIHNNFVRIIDRVRRTTA